MAKLPMWRRYARFFGPDAKADVEDELRFHINSKVEDLLAQGWTGEAARREAERQFGNLKRVQRTGEDLGKQQIRILERNDLWAGWAQDLKYSIRGLSRDFGFTGLALGVLTLGIGANTAVFSIVNSVLLRPLAYGHANRLVALEESIPQLSYLAPVLPVNGRHFLEWKENSKTLDDLALLNPYEANLTGAGDPERVNSSRVTPNLFEVLGIQGNPGRTFSAAESRENVAVISDSLWERRFARSPSVIGQTLSLDGMPHTVVGVLPPDYRDPFEQRVEVYVPWSIKGEDWGWAGDHNYRSVARLREGVTPKDAIAELNVLEARIATRFEDTGKLDLLIHLTPLKAYVVTRSQLILLTLMGAVGAVLLIACFNLGNLMFVRSLARGHEVSIRAALGASIARTLRADLLDSLLLSASGAVLGILLARVLVEAFRRWPPVGVARTDEVILDSSAMLFAAALAVLTSVVFAAIPAWRQRKLNPQLELQSSGRSFTEGRKGFSFRETMVGAEVGLSAALLIVAGLLIHSSLRLAGVERGFDSANVLTAELSLPNSQYGDPDLRRRFFERTIEELQTRPGVVAVGVVSLLPLRGDRWSDVVTAEGDERPIAERPVMSYRPVSSGYFRAMGIPLQRGRSIENADHPRLSAVLSARAAEFVWPGQDAIGKTFRRGDPKGPVFEVVGIVGDVRSSGLDKLPEPLVYVPLWARVPSSASIAVRTKGDPLRTATLLREVVRSIDSQVPLANVQTMLDIEHNATAHRSFLMNMVASFALVALLIAALGTYSVLAWSTGKRRAEIGIRIALGASAGEVRAMVLRQGLRPVLGGLACGLVAAVLGGRVLSSLLFEVNAVDLTTYIAVTAVTLGTAMMACWLPAYGASRISPVEALRCE